jgi:sigma-B regulation protein RsbU (phosphoserine phosphatase)
MTRVQKTFEEARRRVRDYAGDVRATDFKRLFDRDAVQAYQVLGRDHGADDEPDDSFDRFVHRTRVFFLGLSSKLSPVRRVLLFLGLALFGVGIFDLTTGLSGLGDPRAGVLSLVSSVVVVFFLFTMELVDRVLVRDELEVAKELQQGLLPANAPELPDYRFAHSYRTANEVGGDYYDFLDLEDGRLALVVGDASGHGMAAGLLMAIANATLKTALDLDPEPSRVLAMLNRALARTGDRRAFMSLFYAVLDPASGHLDFLCAGHPFPMLRRANGTIEELGSGALPLGLRDPLELQPASATLEPGDLLLLYSDGLVEAVRADGEAFGFERLRELLETAATPQAVHDRILSAFDRFVGDAALHDDLTLVVISRESRVSPPES